jgi:hypothetical protein
MSMSRSHPTALLAVFVVATLAPAQAPPAAPNGTVIATSPAPATYAAPATNLPCGPVVADASGDRGWAEAEYLFWWMRGQSLPSLVTTSPPGTPTSSAGVLGAGGTSTIFGDSMANSSGRSGGRVTAGVWFGDGDLVGLQASFLMLETKATGFAATSTGSPILARPFIDATTGLQTAVRVANPGELSGDVGANVTTTGLIGADLFLRSNLLCGSGYRLDVLGGYRFLRFADRLEVTQDSTSLSPNNPNFVVPGTRISVADQFATKNDFNGFDLGLSGDLHRGPFSLTLTGNLAVGYNQQDVDINGLTTVNVPGTPPVQSTGGLLALTTNIGHHHRGSEVSVIPEFDAKLGYQVTPRLRATFGYTFLYWDNVVRAADQIDRFVNPSFLPGAAGSGVPARPVFNYHRDNMWIQGLEFGVEYCF